MEVLGPVPREGGGLPVYVASLRNPGGDKYRIGEFDAAVAGKFPALFADWRDHMKLVGESMTALALGVPVEAIRSTTTRPGEMN